MQVDALNRTNIFAYDLMSRKIVQTLPGGQSEGFAYDLDGNQVAATNFNGASFDGRGSTRFPTSLNGTVENTYAYDAFGNVINSTGKTPNNFLYCSYQNDPDIGLVYDNARYLNLNTGRFWTRDSADGNNEDPLSLHKYLYAADDPVNMVDPSGHEVAVYTHIVFWYIPPFRHANIRLYPDNTNDIPASLIQEPNMEYPGWQADTDGGLFVTIGAGNDDHFTQLTAHINRPGDLGHDPSTGQNRRRFAVQPPGGLSNDQFIVELLEAEQHYFFYGGVGYFPFPLFGAYNSNSYVVGLLYTVTGVNYSGMLPVTAAGRGKPVPPGNFTPTGGFSATVDSIGDMSSGF